LIGAGTSAVTQLAAAAAGTLLTGQGAGADPSFSATPTLGIAGSVKGTLAFAGNTSGAVTVQPAAAAGTWTMTLPTAGGSSGYVLQTDGAGVTSWVAAGSGATITLGAAANATNPQRSGDATTGFYTSGANTVNVAAGGIEAMRWNTL